MVNFFFNAHAAANETAKVMGKVQNYHVSLQPKFYHERGNIEMQTRNL